MNILEKIKYKITSQIRVYHANQKAATVKRMILDYYDSNPPTDKEVEEAVTFLKSNPLRVFFGPFVKKYNPANVNVQKDVHKGLYFVDHFGRRLYFKRSYNANTIRLLYNGLLSEQDVDSPHRYTGNGFGVKQGSALLDIGSAEGIFSLSNIERLGKVYLFERDDGWVEALEATFAPWSDKVEIISRFVSDKDDEDNISIDTFLSVRSLVPDFIKIDVEGAEELVLDGMKETIERAHPKIALCTYHKQDDFNKFKMYLVERGYQVETPKGMMFFMSNTESPRPPFFRKGLIRATYS